MLDGEILQLGCDVALFLFNESKKKNELWFGRIQHNMKRKAGKRFIEVLHPINVDDILSSFSISCVWYKEDNTKPGYYKYGGKDGAKADSHEYSGDSDSSGYFYSRC